MGIKSLQPTQPDQKQEWQSKDWYQELSNELNRILSPRKRLIVPLDIRNHTFLGEVSVWPSFDVAVTLPGLRLGSRLIV